MWEVPFGGLGMGFLGVCGLPRSVCAGPRRAGVVYGFAGFFRFYFYEREPRCEKSAAPSGPHRLPSPALCCGLFSILYVRFVWSESSGRAGPRSISSVDFAFWIYYATSYDLRGGARGGESVSLVNVTLLSIIM